MRRKVILTILFVALAFLLVQTFSVFRYDAAAVSRMIDCVKNPTPEKRQTLKLEHDSLVRHRYIFCWLTVANVAVIIIYGALSDRKRLA